MMLAEEIQTTFEIDKTSWTKVKLGDVVREVRETVKDPVAEGIERIVGLEHLEPESLHIRTWGSLTDGTTFTKVFRKGQVLFGRRRAYLRKAALATFDGICSGDITVLEAKKGLLPELLPFLIQNDKFFDLAVKNSAGSLSPRAKFADFADYEFLLPPIDQQEQIADLLWAGDEMVQKNMEALSMQRDLFESSRNSIFSIDSAEFSLNILHDSNFIEKHFDKFLKDKTLNGIYKSKEYQGKGVRIINMGELFAYPVIRDEDMSLIDLTDKEKEQYLVKEGDLLFARRSLVIEGAGKCAIIGEHTTPMTFESSMIRVRLDTDKMNPEFVFHFLKSKEGRKRIRRIVGFTTVAGITSTDLAKVKLPFVSIENQNKIVAYLEQFEKVFKKSEELIKNSKRFQKTIINQIF